MRKILHTLILLFCAFTITAQVNVKLGFNHKVGDEFLKKTSVGTTDLDQSFNLYRLQFYVSQIIITHDGGTKTPIKDQYILVDAFNPEMTNLGAFNIDSVESITFSIGVEAPTNNGDPAKWPIDHPLAPRFPSMHWGWSAGYRFVAMEGYCDDELDKFFEIHALGNDNYFSTTVPTNAKMVNGELIIGINADYSKALSEIDVEGGVLIHGSFGEAISLLQNFRDNVFSSAEGVVSIDKAVKLSATIYPNPSEINGVSIQVEDPNVSINSIQVWNHLGQKVKQLNSLDTSDLFIPVTDPGNYIIIAFGSNGRQIRSKIVIL